MDWHIEFIEIIKRDFEFRKKKNPRYSLRQFAKKIGLSPGALSECLNDKRRLTTNRAEDILNKLSLPNREKNKVLVLMGKAPEKQNSSSSLQSLNWNDLAILALLGRNYHPLDTQNCAKRLGLSESEVENIFQRLLSAKLIEKNEDGFYVLMNSLSLQWKTTLPSRNAEQFENYKNWLQKGFQSKKAAEQSSFQALTFSCSKKMWSEVEKEISQALSRIACLFDEDEDSETYHLSIQAFPLDFQ